MSEVKNSYPELPVLPIEHTSVDMAKVIAFAVNLTGFPKEAVRSTYCIFRNESGNGKDGVDNNYGGIQADVGRWEGLTGAIGTSVEKDGNGDVRRFLDFGEDGYKICFEFICSKVTKRGIYIGAPGIVTPEDLAEAYQKKWVSNPPEDTPQARKDFVSLYHSSLNAIV